MNMKHAIITILLALVAVAGQAKEKTVVWEKPPIAFNRADYLVIQKVEITKQQTNGESFLYKGKKFLSLRIKLLSSFDNLLPSLDNIFSNLDNIFSSLENNFVCSRKKFYL